MSVEGTSVEAPVLDVAAFYEVVTAHLEAAFGRRRPLWVRGEVAKVYEKGHVYLDLVDGGSDTADTRRPVLNAHCWSRQWGPLKARLAADGVTLAPGMTVTLYGYVDVYAPQGKIGFSVLDVDVTSLLGELARRRQELIGRLRAEGLLEANARHPVPAVPLRVGVVASPATEGFRDFAGVLEGSGFAFALEVVASLVQGEGAPPQIVAALESLAARAPDVICVVRGGGSRGDLACFDDESVARAIAHCPVPVFTGIGHTGDESVATWSPTRGPSPRPSSARSWSSGSARGARSGCAARRPGCASAPATSSTRPTPTWPSAAAPWSLACATGSAPRSVTSPRRASASWSTLDAPWRAPVAGSATTGPCSRPTTRRVGWPRAGLS
ncbi:MAG TPA: exodeoxyribonuclease VII large subunit [Acidimicrobiales bacterium]|nr:exodeoxyribonuclease VII large subunit [Acidimicrobiales bacterium]